MDKTPLVHLTPNLIMNARLLEAAYAQGVSKTLFFSSNTVYPLTDFAVKESDANFEYTARREAFEEVNFGIKDGELITALTQLYIPVSNFLVHPYLFFTPKKPALTPDKREVEKILEFDIFDLLKTESQSIKDIQIEKSVRLKNIPYFNIQEHVVWGATAMILSELKMILEEL